MAAFQTSSKWLKLAFLEVHLALFLFLFPLAAVGNIAIGPASILTVTGFLLLLSCILTYTWVFVKEIYNNRLIHMGVLSANFLVGVLGIASVIVLFQWREHARVDNVIEAAIGTAILATVAGIFVLTEMKAFRMVLPRRKQKVMKVEPTEKEPNTNADVNKESAVDSSRSESADISRDEKTVNGPFYKRSLWLKYALYLFGLSLFFNFLPNEPVMGGGTREVTIMVYFFSILATTFLFCWVFLGTLSKNRGLHVLSAIFVFLTGFFSIVLMAIWLVSWSMLHPFTPVLIFCAGLLACLAGVAIILEIRQHKSRTQSRYLDRECTASCFNVVIKLFGIPGVSVVVEEEKDINGDIAERYAADSRVETNQETPVRNRDTPPTERGKETILSVDKADNKEMAKNEKNVKINKGAFKDVQKDYRDSGNQGTAIENASLDPVPDGYNSPRKVPEAPPFPEKEYPANGSSEGQSRNENNLRGSNELEGLFTREGVLPATGNQLLEKDGPENDLPSNMQQTISKNDRKQSHRQNKNETITGLQSNDKLPPVSGMGEESTRKGFNPFEDDD